MTTLRRLIDLPGVDALEYKALMKPRLAEPEAREEFPEIAECVKAVFGLTPDEAEAAKPDDWDGIDEKPPAKQVEAFEAAGWDVTDAKGKPLRMLGHFSAAMWLAIRGVAGALPAAEWKPEVEPATDWGSSLAAEAKRFTKR